MRTETVYTNHIKFSKYQCIIAGSISIAHECSVILFLVKILWNIAESHKMVLKDLAKMLYNGNRVLPIFQMAVAVMGFVKDFCYGLYNS